MAFDGFYKDTKTVRPRPSRDHRGRPYKPPVKQPNPLNPAGKPRPRPAPLRPSVRPSVPTARPVYGTAVPATGKLVSGLPRARQFLRWYRPPIFDTWGYASSFGYLLQPVLNLPGGWTAPAGWKMCGQLKGDAIPQGTGYWPPSWGPKDITVCRLVPIGGQWRPTPSTSTDNRSYIFHETTGYIGSNPIGTTHGLIWRPNNVATPGPPVFTPGKSRYLPDLQGKPWLGLPQPRPGVPPRPLPYPLQPTQPVASHPAMGPSRTYDSYWPNPQPPAFDPGRGGGDNENPHHPPGPRVKERKGKVAKWFGQLAAGAWEVTEAVDVVDNLFECLPKKIQKKAPKTGTTLPDAWAPGIKYTTAIDRAKHVYNNVNELDLDCAMRKLTCNHIEDMIWGRFFGESDRNAQRMGLKGFGRANRGSGAPVSKEAKAAFDEWIKKNPALDALRKSLDCENLLPF